LLATGGGGPKRRPNRQDHLHAPQHRPPLSPAPHHLALGAAHGGVHPQPRDRRRFERRRRRRVRWWLVAAATGPEAYNSFLDVATGWFGILVGVGLTWALVFHTGGGIRHYVLDIGAGYELRTNRRWSWITIIGSFVVTAAIWAYILGVK
jgi:succinate dehydrogenase / fumarate reductase cytochrome b subunit